MECKHLERSGLREYLLDNYNWIDFIVLSLYLASYTLRVLVDSWIKEADIHYKGTSRAISALLQKNRTQFFALYDEIFYDVNSSMNSYFMKACKTNVLLDISLLGGRLVG
jgi:hypothetical protein